MSKTKIDIKDEVIKDIEIAIKEAEEGKGEPIETVAKEFRVRL